MGDISICGISMLSKQERSYIYNNKEFEKTYSPSYIRALRNRIRKKVGQGVMDLIQVVMLDYEQYSNMRQKDLFTNKMEKGSGVGREPKKLMVSGVYSILSSMYNFMQREYSEEELKELKRHINENGMLIIHNLEKDTKAGSPFAK